MLFYIVDDEESIHESLKRVLSKKYPDVAISDYYDLEDLVDELRRIRKNPDAAHPDLIFLDNMFDKNSFSSGGATGIETLPRIRKQAPSVPIILFTAIDNYDEVQRIKEFPEIKYLHKPIDETQLYMMVEDILREHGQIQNYEQMIRQNESRIEDLRKQLEAIENDDEKAEKIYAEFESVQEKVLTAHEKDFAAYLDEMKQKFPQFDALTVRFLATGEYFYHQTMEEHIDYSPIAIDYVKGIERLATQVLQRRGIIEPKKKVMLGEASLYIRRFKQNWKEEFQKQVHRVHSYRNRTCHPKGISREVADNVRRILFDSEWVENGEGLLSYLNEELARE